MRAIPQQRPWRDRTVNPAGFPSQRLEEMVSANLNVGGDVWIARVSSSAEHDVFRGGRQKVVDDLHRTRRAIGKDGLRIHGGVVNLRNIAVDDCDRYTIGSHAFPDILRVRTVYVAPVYGYVLGKLVRRRQCRGHTLGKAANLGLDFGGNEVYVHQAISANRTRRRGDLKTYESIVAGSR